MILESFVALSKDEYYKTIRKETGYLLNECTNANIEMLSEEGEIDMCKAVEGILKEGEARSLISCVEQLQKNMQISLEEALKNLGKTLEDYEEAKRQLKGE